MEINPIASAIITRQMDQVDTTASKKDTQSVQTAAQPPQQDTVVLSDAAKDLAAKMAGKAAQEEFQESAMAKAREARDNQDNTET